MRTRRAGAFALIATAVCAAALAAGGGAAADTSCVYPTDYPGDSAPKDKIAAWMAGGAVARGVPGELPVMGALAESNLTNLPQGDGDSAGYFQMRVSIWNSGEYQGFPDNPPLQLEWFIDQAIKVRDSKISAGDTSYGSDPSRYGEWDADILLPPEQYRGKYQPYLDQARSLIASGCATETTSPGSTGTSTTPTTAPGGTTPGAGAPDTTPPAARASVPRTLDLRRRHSIPVVLAALSEDCTAAVSATISVPRAARVYRVSAPARKLAAGSATTLALPLRAKLRRALADALRRGAKPRAEVTVILADGAGNRLKTTRTVRFTGPSR